MRAALRIREYEREPQAADKLAKAAGVSRQRAESLLLEAARAARLKTEGDSPLLLDSGGLAARGIAGMIRLHPKVDLEIVPKYADPSSEEWKNDLLFLFLFAQHGTILPLRPVTADTQANAELLAVAAFALLRDIRSASRVPLRQRQKRAITGFELHGHFDAAELAFCGPDGIQQTVYEHSRQNEIARTIKGGLDLLAERISDPRLRAQLASAVATFRPQLPPDGGQQWRRLPPRLSAWQPAYDLAYELVNGQGVGLRQGAHHAPGFLIDTWKLWQKAVFRLSTMAFGAPSVFREPAYPYAEAVETATQQASTLNVVPDVLVAARTGRFVLDAKYKGRFAQDRAATASSDLHQAAATVPAVTGTRSLLVLPSDTLSAGQCEQKRTVTVIASNVRIAEVRLGVRGISTSGGVQSAARALRELLIPRSNP